MFLKFWVGCTLLAALLIVGGLLVVRKETRSVNRSVFLEKHLKRYLAFQAGLGEAALTVADALAGDDDLRVALAPGAPVGPAAAIAERMHRQISGPRGLRPDLFVVFDPAAAVWIAPGSPLSADALRELAAVGAVRDGGAFHDRIVMLEGRAFQVAGAPILAPDGRAVLGGLVLGVELLRYFETYGKSSDDAPRLQHRLSLVHDGKIVGSVMPREDWPALEAALAPDQWIKVREGAFERTIVRMDGAEFDFATAPVEVADGGRRGAASAVFLMRSRSGGDAAGPQLPWLEMAIGALSSLLIASLLALWITRPIKRFQIQSKRMLEGGADLNQRLEINSADETADLADNINQVFGRLYGLASEVQGAAFQVGASSAEISAASRTMLDGLRDQTLKIESSTAAVTELSASIQQVASNAVEATKVAEKSNVAVTAAVDRMQQIRGAVEDAAGKMHELGESSKRIGNIVEVIRQISEQTSLLALNASIEAAHAGEQGRGFAVVADEVSSLARRVGQSAKDIEALIQTIKEQTSEAVRSMQDGTREVEGGTELVVSTLEDLKQLIAVVRDTAAAVQEQAMVSDEIARNMDAVQKIAAEMVAGSEEAVQQGDQLHSLAFDLEQSVGGFNIAPATAAPAAVARPALKSGKRA
jgi:methyl-accepting chemotaxis protein